ncbi:allantoate amidohydrolase [Cryptosporangium aurantiacum]|uniref:N-carbamoyl-L-amino-acid hydrolase n=1 Tax=Cryptosporangium aurantiacum TaxID=134849 RepID=A0A1M7PTT7_9ACTN|nr:allantoate amidohydrolase [Cryptosporangium aurantiacum]SHN20814.1 N-carbamoyl-L-amino-acid hydrolase [Cryptosporangium aurantiacum]
MTSFEGLWADLLPIGRADSGGYRRFSWTPADTECRAWFASSAGDLGLDVETDRNGNQWAWWGTGDDAVVTGSHLDSVPDGGAFDGPLGVVSSLAAVASLRARGVVPGRPIAVVNFVEEEGARFGVPCLGSRLLTGAIAPERARDLRDADGVTWLQAMNNAKVDATELGADPERLARIGTFVELHVEQGRSLVDSGAPVGVASAIWPHGRWRFEFAGEANHAGTTRLADRRDPMLTFAQTVLAAREHAAAAGALATFGRVAVEPNGTNAIASLVRAWLDSRAPDESALRTVVEAVTAAAADRGDRDGVKVTITAESETPVVEFNADLRDSLAALIGARSTADAARSLLGGAGSDGTAPILPTGAGHDAGVLSAHVPTAMLFVRNPTGVSHAPGEYAGEDDCLAGVDALATVLEHLATR